MKKIVSLMLATMALAVAAQASAQTSEVTRAEVVHQLAQAQAQGLLPSNGVQYPPNARTVARNRATFAARHDTHNTASPTNSGYGGVEDGHGSE
ncbi:DUF4148 domain-containing protein [Burkholderia sp. 8Y]|uniref:DUF4148 domain-containing protein n=1 Tax=Burkholderia sp. 8Y TaxID=2653133 RepID=UPI001F292DDD|nr:DUF4148 domain-containing protein [Burkholderia sp. 8Y]